MTEMLRFGTDADLDGLWEVFKLGFGAPDNRREAWLDGVDPARALIVEGPRGEVAAASHIRRFDQWFGGRAVPLAGYSPVAVLPEFRGQGMAKAVVAGQYADLRDRGEVVSGLFPASLALYRSVGFELAGSYVARRFPAAEIGRIRPSRGAEVRRGTVDDIAAVHRCHEQAGPRRDGQLRRDGGWWARSLPLDLADRILYVVDDVHRPGELAGYAIYRHGPGPRPYDYSVIVHEVLAEDPDVLRALWRVVGSSSSQAPWVELVGPAEDDLLLLLANADPVAVRNEIRWMLRLVDARGAMEARGWPATARGSVDLEVIDAHAAWNTGRWVLEVADGSATLTPGGSGTVQAPIGGLSSWWAGYAPATRLARLGLLHSADRSALERMDHLLPAVPPVLPDFY
ncbi:enhanced intracellular survival protein Eis [Aquihabitans daechungensis]|uniref:GNAT family N-acetyltransferase n=1 Tax=Aquihabitans daechungensis TaxID=1052257 RepID=UPI003B9F1963